MVEEPQVALSDEEPQVALDDEPRVELPDPPVLYQPGVTRGRRALARRYYGSETKVKSFDRLVELGFPCARDGKEIVALDEAGDRWVREIYLRGLARKE